MKKREPIPKDTPVVIKKMENGSAAVKGLWTLDKTAFALGISPETLLFLAEHDAPDGPFDLVPFPGDEGFDHEQVDDWLKQCRTRISVLRQLEAHMWKLAAQPENEPAPRTHTRELAEGGRGTARVRSEEVMTKH